LSPNCSNGATSKREGTSNAQVDILKVQLATRFSIQIDYGTDFSEILEKKSVSKRAGTPACPSRQNYDRVSKIQLAAAREVGGWGRDPKKCTRRDWGMGSSTIQ